MILRCNYEELNALRAGARVLLEGQGEPECAVVAPPTERASVAAFVPRLDGDLAVSTLQEQREVMFAVEVIVECLRAEMDAAVGASRGGGRRGRILRLCARLRGPRSRAGVG